MQSPDYLRTRNISNLQDVSDFVEPTKHTHKKQRLHFNAIANCNVNLYVPWYFSICFVNERNLEKGSEYARDAYKNRLKRK